MGVPATYDNTALTKRKYTITTPGDIPFQWPRLKARKNTAVTIRPSNGVESFTVSWQDAVLTSDPDVDLIVKSPDGNEYPCKTEIFFDTYDVVPAISNDDLIAGYKFVKSAALTTLVSIPETAVVEIHTREGVLPAVEYPDYIVIGSVGELYANTKDFVDKNLTII